MATLLEKYTDLRTGLVEKVKLRELQVDLRANPAMFIGGGSILFEEYIKASNLVSKADFIEDPKANAIGYQMLASKQLGYRPTA